MKYLSAAISTFGFSLGRRINALNSRLSKSISARKMAAFGAAAITFFALSFTPQIISAQVKIEVVVNGKAITSYDVSQRVRLMRLTGTKGNVTKRARQDLIDEELKLQEARRVNMMIPEAQVDQAIASIAQNVRMSPPQFKQALGQQGVNISTLRRRLRVQITWNQIVQSRFRATVDVSDQDVTAALLQKGKDKEKLETVEYSLHQIVFVVPKKHQSTRTAKAKREAAAFAKSFRSCDIDLARAKTLGSVVVKDFGTKTETELPPSYRERIDGVEVGRAIGPFPTGLGQEVIAVCDKRVIASSETARAQIKNELTNEEGQILARRYLRDLRRDALIDYR